MREGTLCVQGKGHGLARMDGMNAEKWVGSRAPLEARSGNPEGCWGDSSVDNKLAQSNEAPNSDPSTQVKRQKWWCVHL